MNLLALETATDSVGVAVLRDDGGAAELVHAVGREHAERLAPMIEEVCALAATPLAEVELIVVDIGPGLFTGLRVGVATAKALAQARGLRVLGVSSLDALAAQAGAEVVVDGASTVGIVAPVVDARRGEVFAAAYRVERVSTAENAVLSVIDLGPPVEDKRGPLEPDALVEWLDAFGSGPETVLVVGDGAVRYLHLLAVHPSLDLGRAASLSTPSPTTLARLAALRLAGGSSAALDPAAVVPDYRRPADVRINWEQRAPAANPPVPPDEQAGAEGTGTR